MNRKNIGKHLLNTAGALLIPVLLYVVFSVLTGGRFGGTPTIVSVLRTGLVPVLIAMGMSMNMTMGMWDFSSGAVVMSSALLSAYLTNLLGWGIPGLAFFCMVIAMALTMLTGFLYIRLNLSCIVLSVGLAMVYESFPTLIVPNATAKIGLTQGFMAAMPNCLFVLVGALVIFHLLYHYTVFGYNVRAIGSSMQVAYSSGVNLDKTKFLSFAASGFFFGLAAIEYMSLNVSVHATTGFGSVSLIFDSMMGVFLAVLITKYTAYSLAILIGTLSIRMLGTGLISCGLSTQIRSILTGFFLLITMIISANQGMLESKRREREIAGQVNAALKND